MNRRDADSSIDHHTAAKTDAELVEAMLKHTRPVGSAASPSPHVVFGLDGPREILDACCGGRMWWWNKNHPLAVYVDHRERPAGTIRQKPLWKIAPDVVADFRALPLEDDSFRLVVFDPPHQVSSRAGTGINAEQYGSWEPGERDEALRLGFSECWRVLAPGGTLVFKWCGKVAEVEPTFPVVPVVGTRPRGRKTGPSWVIFYKPLGAALGAVA